MKRLIALILLSGFALAAPEAAGEGFGLMTWLGIGGGLVVALAGGREALKRFIISTGQRFTNDKLDKLWPVVVEGGFSIYDIWAKTGVEAAQQMHGKSNGKKEVQEAKLQTAIEFTIAEAADAGKKMTTERARTYVEAQVKRVKAEEVEKRESFAFAYAKDLKAMPAYTDTPIETLIEAGRVEYSKRQEFNNELAEMRE